ncbi:MAG: hypothetical protein RLZZ184_3579, partial [Cyanobacteriota bacterium]
MPETETEYLIVLKHPLISLISLL